MALDEGLIREARQVNPDAFYIGRLWVANQPLGSSLTASYLLGKQFADQVVSIPAVQKGLFDGFESYNEILGETAPQIEHRKYAHFQLGFKDGLEGLPVEPIAFNFGTGNMRGVQLVDLYRDVLEQYKWLGFHEYDWPTMNRLHNQGVEEGNGGMWLALRYRRIMNDVISALGNKWSVIITECGMTQGVHAGAEDIGFLADRNSVPGNNHPVPISPEDFWESLKWYSDELMKDDYVIGACHFQMGGNPDWATFEGLGTIVPLIKNYQQVIDENDGDETMNDIWVDDLRPEGDSSFAIVPRISTFEELASHFKVEVDKSMGEDGVQDGQWYWKLVGFKLRIGPAAYLPETKQSDHQPSPNILMWRSWPGADTPVSPPQPPYFQRGVAGFTDANGVIGFGYGGGSVVGENGGPDAIWPNTDPPDKINRIVGSDCAKKLGWMGGTDHLTPQPIFKATQKGGSTTPPPSPGPGGQEEMVIELRIDGQVEFAKRYRVSLVPID
jgi:hypothetical protein